MKPAKPNVHDRPATFLLPALAVFAVALAVRLVHDWQIRQAPFFSVLLGDARGYDEWALRLAAGDWIGKDVFYQAPLYPYFLGVIYTLAGHSLMAVRIVQALLGAGGCALLALAGKRLFSPRVGLIAGLGLALYAPAIFFDGLIQKSVLDVFFVCLSLWLLSGLVDTPQRTLSWLGLGLALGGLSLTRENALVLIAVVAFWAMVTFAALNHLRQGSGGQEGPRYTTALKPLASFVLGLAIVLMPVAIRNYAVGGGFYLTTSQFGSNFYIGNNPKSDGTYVALKYGRGTPEYERQDATDIAEHATGRTLAPAEVSSYWTGETLHYITSEPRAWLKLMTRKFALLWNATESVDTDSQETYAEWSWPLKAGSWIGHFGVLAPLALFGCIALWPGRKRIWVLYALAGAYATSVLLFYVVARYRMPLVPMLMLFAAYGAAAVPAFVRGAKWSGGKLAAVAAVIVAVVFANWPVLSATAMQAVTENNLGTALQADGRLDDAIAHYKRAIDLNPADPPAYNNLGTALRIKGDTAQAIAVYKHVLAMSPGYANAHFNLANVLMDAQQVDEAITHFELAAKDMPESVDVQNNYGVALALSGKPAEAAAAFRRAIDADPASSKAHKNLSDMLQALGKNDEALDHMKRAAELSPTDASLHFDLGTTFLEMKKFPEASAEFNRAIALDPRLVEAHNNLGAALTYQGRTEEAIAEFQQALRLDPNDAEAKNNLAAITRSRSRQP